ncbi:MAG TPA: thioredoxin TrxC [Gammaproteobacteria bacterium]|nr:thioredoxin TrxC [Gammaproteobacteria bacterium]
MSQALHIVCPHCDAINRVPSERLNENPVCGKCKAPLFTGRPMELDDHNFSRHVDKSDLPVVVDFWAPWCGPCKMMAPHFNAAARELEPRVRLAKLNTEKAQRTAARFGIRNIPTLAVFRKGREIARQAGAMDARSLTAWIRSHT